MTTITIKGSFVRGMSDSEFSTFMKENKDLRIERLSDQQITIARPRPIFNDLLTRVIEQFVSWNKDKQLGTVVIDKAFLLPNNSIRHATLSWISTKQLVSTVLKTDDLSKLCPDFVLEFRNYSEDQKTDITKMEAWIANGTKLAWLIDEAMRRVYVFEKSKVKMIIGFDKKVSGHPVLPGLELDLSTLL